jgi:hypothetical protein
METKEEKLTKILEEFWKTINPYGWRDWQYETAIAKIKELYN